MTWFQVPDQISPGTVGVIEVGGQRVAICNADGDYFAIDDACSHDGAPLDQGVLDGLSVECPRHGARFDIRTGKALSLPAIQPTATYATRVVEGQLEVEVP
ncbi:MAG TPA: non-heme iron oxygenase ferredoxin subunit [Dehalococcoidia bacterium]|nr:non-heme iron oxygenase ferredoxin subunit [Dehalococcoidia bacterium]